jgi:hypothetical protein
LDRVLSKLTQRIREEFEEQPWLRFTTNEAAQFWGLDLEVCEQVLARLSAVGFLVSGEDERVGPRFASMLDGCREECRVEHQVHGCI